MMAAVADADAPFVAIVDDDASVGRSTKRLLRSFGIDAQAFTSSEDFVQLVGSMPSYHPGCVILDVHMPGLSGLEVQRRLAGDRLPVIFISAHDEPEVREQALAAGAIAFLRKPFRDDVFIQAVREALRRSAGEGK